MKYLFFFLMKHGNGKLLILTARRARSAHAGTAGWASPKCFAQIIGVRPREWTPDGFMGTSNGDNHRPGPHFLSFLNSKSACLQLYFILILFLFLPALPCLTLTWTLVQ